jgi:hypothetical protein
MRLLNRYVEARRRRLAGGHSKAHTSSAMSSVCFVSGGLGALEVWWTTTSRWREGSHFLVTLFSLFFGDGEMTATC